MSKKRQQLVVYPRASWSQEEEEHLISLLGDIPPPLLCNAYNRVAVNRNWPKRSRRALFARAEKLGLSVVPTGAWINHSDVAKILGISTTTVDEWFKIYKIPQHVGLRTCYVRRYHMVRFARSNPEALVYASREHLFQLLENEELVDFVIGHRDGKRRPHRVKLVESGRIFPSLRTAAKAIGCHGSTLRRAAKNGVGRVNGRTFQLLVPSP